MEENKNAQHVPETAAAAKSFAEPAARGRSGLRRQPAWLEGLVEIEKALRKANYLRHAKIVQDAVASVQELFEEIEMARTFVQAASVLASNVPTLITAATSGGNTATVDPATLAAQQTIVNLAEELVPSDGSPGVMSTIGNTNTSGTNLGGTATATTPQPPAGGTMVASS